MYKLFLELGSTYVTQQEIKEYIGDYGAETIYLLKEFSGRHYYYDSRMQLFSLDNISSQEDAQEYIDSLPVFFSADKAEVYIEEGHQQYGFSEVLLEALLNDNYRRTGDTFHRSRLSLAALYSETLRKFYPEGIHLDDEELAEFKRHVTEEYGVDVIDRSNHAVGTIISRIGIACGRGRYKCKEDKEYISAPLQKRIHNYISTNPLPIIMCNSVFIEFEDDLVAEGVDNRYYLQGILRELFGGEWYFNRDYISKDSSVVSFYDAIVAYIKKATSPVSKAELQTRFPGITDIVLSMAISDSEVLNLFGSYITASKLSISDEEVTYLRKVIEESMGDNGICYSRDLFDKVSLERPGLLPRNYIMIAFGLFSLLEYLFSNDYNFSRPFIAREGAEIRSIASVLKEMVEESDRIALSTLLDFAAEHHYPLTSVLDFAAQCNATHLMINDQELASLEYIGITDKQAMGIVSIVKAEVREAMPIAHLSCLSELPKINVEWNAWLIYSILRKWSQDLQVGTSKSLYRLAYPIVAPAGVPLEVEYDESISHNGYLVMADDLENIDALVEDYIADELGDIDEFSGFDL